MPVPRLARAAFLLLAVALAALAIRGFVAVPRSVPSPSMLPALRIGDVFLTLRWPYGSPLAGTFDGRGPRRGEIVVVGGSGDADVVKRVIGLPGDRVALRAGAVILNGRPVPRFRVADYVVPVDRNDPCPAAHREKDTLCRIRRWRELLPGGVMYDTLDQGATAGDDMAEETVPPAHLFLLGDNRDDSGDSRFSADAGGLGMVDVHRLRGRAAIILWSSDGSARAGDPVSWWRGLRGERIGLVPGGR